MSEKVINGAIFGIIVFLLILILFAKEECSNETGYIFKGNNISCENFFKDGTTEENTLYEINEQKCYAAVILQKSECKKVFI